ncbi:MAG: hypothetical protein QOH06_2761 [Acidobacteriota bacterium]|jgi:hypothetical protein|nr:hypothetical protein [Acidobacteriota bacterium]
MLTAQEYEGYVAEVLGNLDVFPGAVVYRNRNFEGVRQPGSYEIDIAIEFFAGEALRFLLIVECKNWKRPVDRPVVQKLAQTRDAVAAHKAAIASPVGFTSEAIEVAKVHGIALWVVASGDWLVILAAPHPVHFERLYYHLRIGFLEAMGFKSEFEVASDVHDHCALMDFAAVISGGPEFKVQGYGGSAFPPGSLEEGIDPGTAGFQVAQWLYEHAFSAYPDSSFVKAVQRWTKAAKKALRKSGISPERVTDSLEAVINGSGKDFMAAVYGIAE